MTSKLRHLLLGMLLAGLCAKPAIARSSLDMMITGGQVYTMPPDTVIGITDGKFSYLGPSEDAQSLVTATTEHIDAQGSAIYPGFIDLHTHLFDTIGFEKVACKLDLAAETVSIGACRQTAATLSQGQWLIGFAQGLLTIDLDGLTPREWLDAHFTQTPVVISEPHSSVIWMNSVALSLMKITKHSVDPIGGKIIRTAENIASGIVLGSLSELVLEEALKTYPLDMPKVLSRFGTLSLELQRLGITSIGESGGFWCGGGMKFWEEISQQYNQGLRLSVRPRLSPFKGVNDQLAQLRHMYRNDLNARYLLNQVKINVDGQYRLGTARLSYPYHEPAVKSEPNGLFYFTPTELNSWLMRLKEIGFSAYIHAEGDSAVEASLYSIQNARRNSDDQRFTVTGMQFIKPVQYPLFNELGVTVNFLFNAAEDAELAHSATNHAKVVSVKALEKFSTSIALSSGGIGAQYVSPLERISENLQQPERYALNDIHKAIESYTIEPAKSLGIESVTGSIVIGKSADLAFVDKDLTKLNAEQIAKSTVLMTMLQGEITFVHEKMKSVNQTTNSLF
ncbi:amidohydrolase family protein [Photobacterium japonica]|uniref:amidohydrolase n=1 Tax=Photobacterium japonica TaxID=2910235 RepID=UPI003D12E16F